MGAVPRARDRRLRDTGSETVGLAILFPLALLLILTIVQAGLLWHARNVLSGAAQSGVDTGRVLGAGTADAQDAALSFARRAGAGVVDDPAAAAVVSAETVQVSVSGTAQKVLPIPGVQFRFSMRATAAKERFTVPGSAP
ncbi:TadE/TadG family type IV pilus assembly protein [Prauserella muralis]|uniref:Uncharacterized protein n=1 Tax=Prauserella muralis TaxID=588067 RepID=A0A2V4AYT0_9PSEU|nr:TadE/TadG family type IV pilus assembly protein [Prauserella muralis]PXY25421.1 hypothetical protein BAY60_18780 [Prauserella muralis]TWE27535.1 TadE-like protein [Prauserella muralis]